MSLQSPHSLGPLWLSSQQFLSPIGLKLPCGQGLTKSTIQDPSEVPDKFQDAQFSLNSHKQSILLFFCISISQIFHETH